VISGTKKRGEMYEIHQKLMKKRELKQKEKDMAATGAEPLEEAPKAKAAVVPPARAIPQSSFMNDAIMKKS